MIKMLQVEQLAAVCSVEVKRYTLPKNSATTRTILSVVVDIKNKVARDAAKEKHTCSCKKKTTRTTKPPVILRHRIYFVFSLWVNIRCN